MINFESEFESTLLMEDEDESLENDFEEDLEGDEFFDDEGDFESFETIDSETNEEDLESLAYELVAMAEQEGEVGDAEVEQFWGALASIGSGLIGKALKSKTFRKIAGSVIKKGASLIKKVSGGLIPGLSGLNIARRVIRTVTQAGAAAARNSGFARNAAGVARAAIGRAIRRNFPRKLRKIFSRSSRRGGRWIRRGSRIILFNA